MANRYWVGGTDNWDATAGSKWALTSGGAGGASVPTTSDDVFFDAASGAVTVTVSATANCLNLNFTGFTGTFAGGSQVTIFGNMTAVAGMTWTHNGLLSFNASSSSWNITTGGKTILGSILFGITVSSASWTLQDALNCSSAITVNSGTFTTNNFNVTATALNSSNSNTRTINLGSSTVTLSGTSGFAATTSTNLTLNAGTSTIICSFANGGTVNIGNITTAGTALYNISFTSTTAGASHFVVGVTSCNNFSITGPSTVGRQVVNHYGQTTINGTFSTTGTAGNRRVVYLGTTYGLAQTLTINSAPSLTDVDFRDIYVKGTSAPISGTRIGNRGGCSGITFDAAKTVYWVTLAGGNWSGTNWSNSAGGTASDIYFPLPQDTANFVNTGLNTSATVTLDAAMSSTGLAMSGIDMSARSNAMTLAGSTACVVYGNWTFSTAVTMTHNGGLTFSGRNTQTITSAGKSFQQPLTIDSYGGTVQLADALTIGNITLTVTNGTFDTKGYAVSAGSLSSSNTNVRTISLGASTVTLSSNPIAFSTNTNLTFNAGTSTIIATSSIATITGGGSGLTGVTFYDVSFTSTAATGLTINGINTFRNISVTAPSSNGLAILIIQSNQTINGTLTVAGATAVRRVFVRSDTLGTTRTLTVNTLSATDCDFRDITLAGTAAGSSPTRAGDCGGNTGITFPAAKTVYWNLAGAQNWSATAWATSSGGSPAINNFPLAQDTLVFDNAGSVTGTITQDAAWNMGTFDASARTSAMTIQPNNISVYGNWKNGTGLTLNNNNVSIEFLSNGGTQTITSNGVSFNLNKLRPSTVNGKVILADALTTTSQFQYVRGEFDANGFNVTVAGFEANSTNVPGIIRMGSGLWTMTGTSPWGVASGALWVLYKGTANILLSDTSTSARNFSGGGLSYNKLTIGGATGTSTLTFTDSNQFTELASTKTVAHTIDFGSTTQTFGAWTVSGTSGNVVTVSGTATITIAGARVSGVDYLALGTTTLATTFSPAEFYAGANSTGGTGFILTAAPTPVTRYWRGGTGTWDATTTTNWSASSGGAGGASVPTSADAVVFDSASNATAYTVTLTANQLRCGSFTMAGPLTGNVTWAGSADLSIQGNISLSATGITFSFSGNLFLSGSTTGKTINTNGISLSGSSLYVYGFGCGWTLNSALNIGSSTFSNITGAFDTNGYAFTVGNISSTSNNSRSFSFGSSTISSGGSILLGNTEQTRANLSFNAGTSQINVSINATSSFNNQTLYNVAYTSVTAGNLQINNANTFNNLSFTGLTSSGLKNVSFSANQTISGTLTISAGTDATMRTFLQSDTLGTTRTLTVNAFSGTDADFRDITVTGTAAPISGTRLGNCKGNSGITFGAGVTRYWNLAGGGNWGGSIGWAATSGGSPAINNFPLAQDTALIEATGLNSGTTITINAAYNIGTINMSARTSNTMTLATGSNTPFIYGNWINGTGVTLSGTQTITFAGRGSQTITNAGRTFTQVLTINSPSGAVTLQDALISSYSAGNALNISNGTFDANNFNVTVAGTVVSVGGTRTIAVGSGTWTLTTNAGWSMSNTPPATITGTGTISLTSASAKSFSGAGLSHSGITVNQGGAGTLTITGNNTFANITNTYSATGATTINFSTSTHTVGAFTAKGEAGRVLTIQGQSGTNPATLILTSGTVTTPDYLAITGVRAYNLSNTWYAGNNSTNNGSLGWIFASGAVTGYMGNFFAFF